MTKFWDLNGSALTLIAWAELLEDRSYGLVAETDVLTSDGRLLWVSTRWLGFCQKLYLGFPDDRPFLTFETLVFESGSPTDYRHHYSTLEEAERAHTGLVKRLHAIGAAALDDQEAWHS
jgi:hypothetical protein